jgi:hypothetical protein
LGNFGSIRSICRDILGLRKGSFGKLQYRVSMNGAATNNLQAQYQQMVRQPIRYLDGSEAGRTYRIF